MAEVRTGVHVFAICVKTEIIFKMRSTSFFHVSVPNIYGTSSSTYLIIFLKVISKVLFFNITQKFTNLLVQLSIFLIDLFVGNYRLSSHARLEAFVIQTKLKTKSENAISMDFKKLSIQKMCFYFLQKLLIHKFIPWDERGLSYHYVQRRQRVTVVT